MGFTLGKWKAQCDRCGVSYLNTQLAQEWTGLRVCRGGGTNDCWEPRHPQDFVRGKADRQAPPWSRPEQDGPDVSPGSGNEVSPGDL
jgi:hypothetical protein